MDIVWVPIHCGLRRNEFVDFLAKKALDIPIEAELAVPIDYGGVGRRVKIKNLLGHCFNVCHKN